MSALRDSRPWAAIGRELVCDPYTSWMKHCLCRSLRPAGERADRQWQALPCRCRKWCGHAVGQGGIGDMGPSEHLIEMAGGAGKLISELIDLARTCVTDKRSYTSARSTSVAVSQQWHSGLSELSAINR